jgi:hypothetical protein
MKTGLAYRIAVLLPGLVALAACAYTIPSSGDPFPGQPLPDVIGQDGRDAMVVLAETGFTATVALVSEDELIDLYGSNSSRWPEAGTVIRMSPEPGSTVELGTTVHLSVAFWDDGPGGIPGPPGIVVPDLVGMGLQEALRTLAASALDVSGLVYLPSSQPDGIVLSQAPPPGQHVPLGTAVTLVVAAAEIRDSLIIQVDVDSDGVPDANDRCPATPEGIAVDSLGCPIPTQGPSGPVAADMDEDGVLDAEDSCLGTTIAAAVNRAGCSDAQLIDKLPMGTYAFNTPDTMVAYRRHLVVLVLEPDQLVEVDEVQESVTEVLERFSPQQRQDTIRIIQIPYFDRMKAVLTGPAEWTIKPRQSQEDARLVSGHTSWEWDVYPNCPEPTFTLDCGEARLTIAAYAYIGDAYKDWQLFEEDIIVRITPLLVVRAFVTGHWEWFLGTIIIPLIGLIWRSRRKRARVTRILMLAANQAGLRQLDLAEEVRAIDDAIRKADYRNQFRIDPHGAVRSTDLDDLLLRHKPHIVHFSGHGSSTGELVFRRQDTTDDGMFDTPIGGNGRRVSPQELGRLFAAIKGNVRCVVLSACYSEAQARAIADQIECVVGMTRTVSDAAAIQFGAAFYHALASGENVKTAFAVGRSELERGGLDEADTPKLIAKRIDPDQIVFVSRGRSKQDDH